MYQVVNTETGEVYASGFASVDSATEAMIEMFPVVVPWDGVEVNVGVQEVK